MCILYECVCTFFRHNETFRYQQGRGETCHEIIFIIRAVQSDQIFFLYLVCVCVYREGKKN